MLRSGRGGSNDNDNAETTTNDNNYKGGGKRWEQLEIGHSSAAPPRVDNARQTQLTPMPTLTLMSTSASRNDCIGTLRQQWRGQCCLADCGMGSQERAEEDAMTAVKVTLGWR